MDWSENWYMFVLLTETWNKQLFDFFKLFNFLDVPAQNKSSIFSKEIATTYGNRHCYSMSAFQIQFNMLWQNSLFNSSTFFTIKYIAPIRCQRSVQMDGQSFMSLMNNPRPVGGLICIHYADSCFWNTLQTVFFIRFMDHISKRQNLQIILSRNR